MSGNDKWTRRLVLQRAMHLGAMGVAGPLAINLAAIGEAAASDSTDCKALVCIFLYGGNDYANTVVPFDDAQKNLSAYLDRLMERPSFARVLREAQPYFDLFPLERKPQIARPRRVATS